MTKPASERRAVVYVRISKDRDREVSTTIQRETAERYCKSKGWHVVAVHEDRGRSAYKRNVRRSALDATMADIESGMADTLVVYRLDRVSRSVADFAALWHRLSVAGCEFVSVQEQFDTSTSMGKAMLQIAMVFAELESAIKSERSMGVHELRRAMGGAPAGPLPFGYDKPKKGSTERTINAAQAKLVCSAAKRILDGESLRSIVREWNDRGITTAKGGAWSSRSLRVILVSPHSAALRSIDGVLVAGTWPALFDRATHEKLVEVLDHPARRTSPSNKAKHLLSGIAICELCDTPMGAKPHVYGMRYVCGPRRGYKGCGRQSIGADVADAVVTRAVLAALDKRALSAAIDAQTSDPGALVEQLESELEMLASDYGSGDLSRAQWQAARGGLEQRLDAARRAASRSRSAAPLRKLRDSKNRRATFDAMTVADKRLVLLATLDGVGVKAASKGQQPSERINLTGYWRDAKHAAAHVA
jgi:site-specific DNA recombinase